MSLVPNFVSGHVPVHRRIRMGRMFEVTESVLGGGGMIGVGRCGWLGIIMVGAALIAACDASDSTRPRLEPDAPSETVVTLRNDFSEGPVFVHLSTGPANQSRISELKGAGLRAHPGFGRVRAFGSVPFVAGVLVSSDVDRVSRLPFVERIESSLDPDGIFPQGQQYGWNLAAMEAPDVWRSFNAGVSAGGNYAYVAVVDFGLDTRSYRATGYDPYLWQVEPYFMDVASHGAQPWMIGFYGSSYGHGTMVASVIAADTLRPWTQTDAYDTYSIAGVAPKSYIMGYNIYSNDYATLDWAYVVDALDRVEIERPEVVNMSFGNCGATPPLGVYLAISDLTAVTTRLGGTGVVMVASAGNGTRFGDCTNQNVSFPAAYPDVIAVGAVDGSLTAPAQFSVGAEMELVAPGWDVPVIGPNLSGDTLPTWPTGGYASGTSYAAAHVSGAVALIRAEQPAWSASKIRSELQQTARKIAGIGSRDPIYGFGLVQPYNVLAQVEPSIAGPGPITEAGQYTWHAFVQGGIPPYTLQWKRNGYVVGSGSEVTLQVDAGDNGSFTVQVVATDGAGTVGSATDQVYVNIQDECPPEQIRCLPELQ